MLHHFICRTPFYNEALFRLQHNVDFSFTASYRSLLANTFRGYQLLFLPSLAFDSPLYQY